MESRPHIVDEAGLIGNWGGVVSSMAEQLGLELDGIESSYELLPADEGFEFQGRRIEAGTIAAMRFEIVGVVGAQPKVAVEHVTRTKADQAPEWARASHFFRSPFLRGGEGVRRLPDRHRRVTERRLRGPVP